MQRIPPPLPERPGPGYRLIFRASRRDKHGNVLRAVDFGLRAWPIWVPVGS
jgi:hypothetical protein